MNDDFGLIVLGIATGAALAALAGLFAFGWASNRVDTVSLVPPAPMFYVPD